MERLTIDEIIEHCNRKTEMYEKACDVKYLETAVMGNGIKEYWEHKQVAKYLRQLKDYEDLEEQGRLIILPCKVGDTVYVVTSPFNVFDDIEYDENMKDEVYESYVSSITFYKSGEQYRIYAKATNHFIGAYFRECDFGKTVFLTQSAAEEKLKELRGGENESNN